MQRKFLVGGVVAFCVMCAVVWLLLRSPEPTGVPDGSVSPEAQAPEVALSETLPEAELEATEETEADPEAAVPEEELVPEERDPLLRGRVLGDGKGIAGAHVLFFSMREVGKVFRRLEKMAELEGGIPDVGRIVALLRTELERFRTSAVEVETTADGSFELDDADETGHIVLTVADGWLFKYGDVVSLERGRTAELTVELERGSSIAGRVVDESGAGVPGINVIAEYRPPGMPGVGRIIRRALRYINGEFLKGPFESKTAADGSFEIPSLPAGQYDLAAYDDLGLESRLPNIETGTRGAVIYFGKGASIEGYFADAEGLPVPSVSAKLERQDSLVVLPLPLAGFNDVANLVDRYLGDGPRVAESGADGRFRFGRLSAGKYKITVEEPGWLSLARVVEVDWGDRVSLGSLSLNRGRTIRGIVTSPDGRPLEGARVMAVRSKPNFMTMGVVMKDFMTGRAQTTSGSDGSFLLAGLGRGPFRVAASSSGYGAASRSAVRPDGDPVDLVLTPGRTVAGRVVAAATGDPVADVTVRVGEVRTRSQKDGSFVLDGVVRSGSRNPFRGERGRGGPPWGRRSRDRESADESEPEEERGMTLKVEGKGFLRTEVPLDFEDLPQDLEVELDVAPEIRGVALTPDGEAAPGALVRLTPSLPDEMNDNGFFDPSLIFLAVSVSDLEGRFTFRNYHAPPGRYNVIADHVLYARGKSESFSFSDRVDSPDVEVSLIAGATVKGTITDGSQPIPGAAVRLSKPRKSNRGETFLKMLGLPKGGKTVHANAEGEYAFAQILPGEYKLSATHVGFTDPEDQSVVLAGGDVKEVDFRLDPGGALAGEVKDDQGQPIAGATVRVLKVEPGKEESQRWQRAFGGSHKSTATGDEGFFEVGGLVDGRYTIVARKRGYTEAEVTEVEPGAKLPVLVLVPAASLRGSVVDSASGEAVTAFRVKLQRDGAKKRRWAPGRLVSDPEGIFEREDLEAGVYRVDLSAAGFVPVSMETSLTAGVLTEASFAMQRAGTIRGSVVDALTGRPVSDVEVALAKQSTGSASESPGAAEARAKNRVERVSDRVAETAAEEKDGDERSAQRAFFSDSMLGEKVTVDDEGYFLLESVPRGPQTVVVTHDDYVQEVQTGVEVALGEEVEVSFALSKGFSVRGRAVNDRGQAAPGQFLYLREVDESKRLGRKSTTTGRDGRFEMSGLTAGSYRLTAPRSRRTEPVELRIDGDVDDVQIIVGSGESKD